MDGKFRLDYDDQIFNVVEIISAKLAQFGLTIVCDDLPHDGFELYEIKKIEECGS